MENFVASVRKNINSNSDWFDIGYEMVEYIINKDELQKMNYIDFMFEIQGYDERILFIVLMKNLVSQVNNGGFHQYFGNGYSSFEKNSERDGDISAHEKLIELYKKYVPKNENTIKLLNIFRKFCDSVMPEDCYECDGNGYIEDECSECNGSGWIDDEECFECNGRGSIETECYSCGGDGQGSYYTCYCDFDHEFYETFNKDMENLFKELFLNWLDNWDKDCILNQFHSSKNESNSNSKPKLKLVGTDGNAFAIIGKLIDCLRRNGYKQEQLEEIRKEATSGDYNNVIATACKYCEVY